MESATTTRGASESGLFQPGPVAFGRRLDVEPPGIATPPPVPLPKAGRAAMASRLASAVRSSPAAVVRAAQLEVERGGLYLLSPVLLALGAILYFVLPSEPWAGWAVLAFAVFLSVARFVPRAPSLAMLGAALLAAGFLLAAFEGWRAGTRILGGEVTTQMTGRVEAIDRLANGRTRLTLAVVATERPSLRYAPQRVRATARSVPDGLAVGSTVRGLVRLQPPSGPVRPGGYDFAFDSYFAGIGANGFFMRNPEHVATGPEADGWQAGVERLRVRVADRITARIEGPAGEIAAALMVGVRAGIPESVNEALRRSGLYHIISISGLHMALVAGTVMGGLRLLLALFPVFGSRFPTKKLAAAAAIAALSAYLFISGAEVAAQRSYIMLLVMLLAVLVDRAALNMRNLATSALVVIAITPHEVTGPSFQMSFAATAALVAAYAWWAERGRDAQTAGPPVERGWLARGGRAFLYALVGLAATSVLAGLATAVFGAYHFQRVSPLGLFANLATMPVMTFVVTPAAIGAALAMPVGLDGPFLDLMGLGLDWMVAIAAWFSERSPVDVVGLVPMRAIVLTTVALLVATLATTWLRWAALPFAVAALLTLGQAGVPDVLVADDARLVGYRSADGTLQLNRSRPNAFTADNWQRALGATERTGPRENAHDAQHATPTIGSFVCAGATCRLTDPIHGEIVHTDDSEVARAACATAAIIVLATPEALACSRDAVVVITARDLARRGSAAIHLADKTGEPAAIEFAIETLDRPWHDHRRYSRAARGLMPYSWPEKPDDTVADPEPAKAPAQ